MKSSRVIWIVLVLLMTAAFACWLSLRPAQISSVRIINIDAPFISTSIPGGANSTPVITGILINPNFQTVLHALQQRNGRVERLSEPEVTTHYSHDINAINYDDKLTFYVTNK